MNVAHFLETSARRTPGRPAVVLGDRGLTYEDMSEVRKVVREAGQKGYRFSALMQGVVSSVPFQMRVAGSR